MKNLLTGLSVSVLLFACVDASDAPAVPAEELPEDVNTWLYVASGVASEGATGTALKPFPSVQMAIEAASAGDGILIEAGTYEVIGGGDSSCKNLKIPSSGIGPEGGACWVQIVVEPDNSGSR